MPLKNVSRSTLRLLRRIGIPALALLVLSLAAPREAEANYYHGRHHGYGHGFRSHAGFHGHFGHRIGVGYYSYPSGPSYYPPRFALPYARRADLGALDLDIKPKKVEVYLDGRYIGRTGEFDGYPDFLWLKEGTHQLAFYKEGYGTVSREYTIYAGELINERFRLERGEAVPPEELSTPPTDEG